MKFQIIKFNFTTAVHFGSGGLNTTDKTFHADTLFSALCKEAVADGPETLNRLVQMAENRQILFSDAFPFIGETLYIPKPMSELKIDREGDSVQKKLLKKTAYVPADSVNDFLKGQLDLNKAAEAFSDFGRTIYLEKAAVTGLEQARPWGVACFRYHDGSGLYICMGYEDTDDMYFVLDLLGALELTGIGGKTSSGLGKFTSQVIPVSADLNKRLTGDDYAEYMLLNGALPRNEELDQAMEQASYRMIRRGGFVASASYADTSRKKRDLYLFQAGSVFRNRFQGQVTDVSEGGSHPVYRYAQAMLMGVR